LYEIRISIEKKTAFDSLELTVTSKLKLIDKDGEKNSKVRYIVPEGEAERYWVKRSLLGEIEDNTVTTKTDISECFRQNPEAITFYKQSGKTAEDLLIKIDGIEKAQDEEKNLWYHIKNQAVDGWICDGDTENLKMLSAFDWPGFSIQKEAGDAAYDPMIDFKNLSPFFKRIVDEINTDRDKAIITNEELKKTVKDEKIAYRLSRLICFHQSEWWVDSEMKYWEPVFRKIGSKQADLQKEVFRNTCWWDEVSQKCKDFLPTPNVYHWHPVAFVENMSKFSRMFDDSEKNRIMMCISKFEGEYWSCNKDSEFSMSKDDLHYAGIVHIGLSWGFIQFTQDGGALGKVLKLMNDANNEKFKDVFGSNWQELITVTNTPGKSALQQYYEAGGKAKADEMRSKGIEFYSSRTKEIAIELNSIDKKHLWQSPWLERFVTAGKEPVFQDVQRKLAIRDFLNPALEICRTYNIRTEKGIALAFDRTVNHGFGASKAIFKKYTGGKQVDGVEEEIQLIKKIRDHWNAENMFHIRIDKILTLNELTKDTYEIL